jgi:hypothetical protein
MTEPMDQIERIRAAMRRNQPDDSKPVGDTAGTLSSAGFERLRHRSILSVVIARWLFLPGILFAHFH